MPGTGVTAATTRLAYVAETGGWGITPPTPAFKNLRIVSESLVGEKTTVRSNELRPDRNVSDEILTGLMGSGSIEGEFSYGSFDDVIAALLFSDWATNVLINGVTPKTFTLEKTNDDPAGGGAKIYQRFPGAMFNTMSLGLSSGQLITASLGVMAKGLVTASAIVTGATYASAGTSEVMSSGAHVGTITTTGALTNPPVIESMTMDITNNLRQRMAVGTLGSVGIGEGRCEVSGTMNAYFSDKALLDAFLAHTDIGLSFILGRTANQKYRVTLPRIKLSSGSLVAGGNDSDLMFNMNYTALFDATTGGTIKIERAIA